MFDSITKDDLIVAFFPCIYFCGNSQILFMLNNKNYNKLTDRQKFEKILERERNRSEFHSRLIKLICLCSDKGLRLIVENPKSDSYLFVNHFVKKPDIVDNNRMYRGDYFIKPTAYWFFNCEPTHGETLQYDKVQKIVNKQKGGVRAGICSEERSMISPDYN